MKPEKSNIANEFVVLGPDKMATKVPVTPTIYQELEDNFNNFKGHELIASYDFESDWGSWEMHPEGDETVILLSGEATFIIDDGQQRHTLTLQQPGEYVVVPKGLWHTAKTDVATRILFITPGEGTQHKADDGND
ncbi:cupin domain-containing protein [Neptunicella sp. SCSIO 80796]|uniref:cupin domain-containing protein n=1 Tax=Neptunicella plasticusilytica TaxID=3117012 RepID=UPI003A4DCC21